MKIHHHPDDATLMSYAAGSLPDALAAVVACHLAMCPRCRAEVSDMEALGALLMKDLPASPVADQTPPLPVAMDAMRITSPALGATPRHAAEACAGHHGDGTGLPAPLARHLGFRSLEEIPWRRLGFGVWHYPVPLSSRSGGDLRLLKVAPGQVMPEHGHGGSELTLLLSGSYRDEIGTFHVGDLADLDDEIEHSPIADPHEGCICLVASDAKARFKGVVARLVQPLTGL